MSVVLKSSSVPSTISNVNKRLVLDDVDHHAKTKLKKQEPKLAAYDIDWFDSSALKNECLKYTHITLDLVIYKIIYERERRELYLFYAQIRPGGTMIPVRASWYDMEEGPSSDDDDDKDDNDNDDVNDDVKNDKA